jgi:hypothetical protein
MSYQAGFGGTVSAVGFAADVQRWVLDWSDELHDRMLISDSTFRNLAGLEDWTCTFEVVIDTDDAYAGNTFKPGSTISNTILTTDPDTANTTQYDLTSGIIERVDVTYEPHGLYRATITLLCNGVITVSVPA